MPERAALFQRVQIGYEFAGGTAIPGSAVPTTRILSSLSIEPSIKVDIMSFRPAGQKFSTVAALSKEWVEAGLSGSATYTEGHIPFASVITAGTPTPEGQTVAGTAYLWQSSPRRDAADTPATFTVERGAVDRAYRFTYGIITEFGVSYSRDGIELSGSMLGRRLEDNITMGTTATALELVPVLPTQTSVFMGTSPTSFPANSQLSRVISYDWTLGSRFGPVWTLDARQDSWVAVVETEPSLEVKLLVEADAEGMSVLPLARAGDTRYIRVEAIGGTIPNTTLPYMYRIDTAVKFTDVGDFSEEDGVYAIEYTGTGVAAAGWGGTAVLVAVRNDQSGF